MTDAPVWVFDGVCVLCSGAVNYLLRHERDHTIRFVAIQSSEGRALAQQHGVDPDNPESFLFIEKGVALQKSDGIIALFNHAGGVARVVQFGRFLPRSMRDWLYDKLARNRYSIFGKRATCHVPNAATMQRFTLPETAR
jgi:predicted DCC family thiol-disulfide oxidoreductase YuxK